MALDVMDYEGTPVTCTTARWTRKIDANHPELSGKQSSVGEAIASPEIVLQDRDYPDRRHLIRRTSDTLYILVVVEYRYTQGSLAGSMVTAFLCSRLRRGDPVLYVKARR